MALFSEGVGKIIGGRASVHTPMNPVNDDQFTPALAQGFGQLSGQFMQLANAERRRDAALRDNTFISASNVAQARFDWQLKKELSKFYTSDGRDVAPPSDYKMDLGFGVSLTSGDFLDNEESGQRRSYTDLVRHMQDKFIDTRIQSAPSDRAEGAAKVRLSQGKLASEMGALKYSQGRREMVLANNINATVGAYKETLQGTRGFDPNTFGLHLNAILESSEGDGVIDAGRARLAALAGIRDLVRVGVTEAHTDRDNGFALSVLAASPLRNTKMVDQAIAGVPASDRSYLKKLVYFTAKRKRIYKRGDALPGANTREYLPWAMAQLEPVERAKIQERAIKALTAQTQVARGELDQRVNGILSSLSGPSLKEPGFREMLRKSSQKAMQDIGRLYPKTFYPNQHARMSARVLAAMELSEMRDSVDGVHSTALSSLMRDNTLGKSINSTVRSRLGDSSSLLAQDIINQAAKVSRTFLSTELAARTEDPYGSLLRASKDVRELEKKLSNHSYATLAEKASDQATLRTRVLQRSNELGVRPSFLSGTDALALKNFATLGNATVLNGFVKQLKDKYGFVSFQNYIVPELAKDDVVGPEVLGVSMVQNPNIQGRVMSAMQNAKANKQTVKDMGFEDDLEKQLLDVYDRGFFENLWDWMGGETWSMKRVDNAISDRYGDGLPGQIARSSARQTLRKYTMDILATGRADTAEKAVDMALRDYEEGLGTRVKFDGKETLAPEMLTLNEPRLERLEDVIRDERFLEEVVFPDIAPNAFITERAIRDGVNPDALLKRYFLDDSIIKWWFGAEGLEPRIGDAGGIYWDGVPRKDGQRFVIPYHELPDLIYWGTK